MSGITFDILILGDSGVGKTSLLLSYADNFFPESHIATIGIDSRIKSITIKNIDINLQLWDTSGQERFRSLTASFYRKADGIIFVYDITSKKTFDSVKDWIRDAENMGGDFEKILIGNKCDLEGKRNVTLENLEKFGGKKKMRVFEASAKMDINVKQSFDTIAELIMGNKTKEQLLKMYGDKKESFSVNASNITSKSEKKRRKCC